jgi:hypothetical protein
MPNPLQKNSIMMSKKIRETTVVLTKKRSITIAER